MHSLIDEAVEKIKTSDYTTAFTGAGISVESGVPPFRGEKGIWGKYDPKFLDIHYFYSYPKESWSVIKEIFYDFFVNAKPNYAHIGLAKLEKKDKLKEVITQNIDNLHQEAGSKIVHEFHGNSKKLKCTSCEFVTFSSNINFNKIPVMCPKCYHLLKPDFVFFGEGIPSLVYQNSVKAAQKSKVMLVIGTTGEVMPACQIPFIAKQNGATIIEINTIQSKFTSCVTDIFLQEKASIIMKEIVNKI